MLADVVTNRVPEWRLQSAIVVDLDQWIRDGAPFAYAAGLEGVPLTPKKRGEMRRQGMQAGEPDLRFYLSRGRLILIELKADGGSVSKDQKDRHALLRSLGFVVHVVKAKTEAEAIAAVRAIIGPELYS
jgi:hypothetical protein